LKHSS